MNYSDRELLKLSAQTQGSIFRGLGEQIDEAYEQEDYEKVNQLLTYTQLLEMNMQLINTQLNQEDNNIKNT